MTYNEQINAIRAMMAAIPRPLTPESLMELTRLDCEWKAVYRKMSDEIHESLQIRPRK